MGHRFPKTWRLVLLEDLVLPQKGKKPGKLSKKKFKNSLPYLDIKAIEKGIVSNFAEIESSVLADEKDVLIVWDGARSGWVGTLVNGAVGSTLMKLRPIIIDSKYIFYFLKSNFDFINSQTKGIGIPHVNQDIFWNLEIPLSPLREQKRISSKLDKLFNNIYSMQSRLDKFPNMISELRQQILHQAVTGQLTKNWRSIKSNAFSNKRDKKKSTPSEKIFIIPGTWTWSKINQIGEVKGGKRIPFGHNLVNNKTDHPYLKAGNLKNGSVIEENIQFLLSKTYDKLKNYTISKDDVYLTIVGAKIGDAGTIPEKFHKANLTENAAKITNLKNVNNNYLSIWLRSPVCQNLIQNLIKSAAQGKLALIRIRELPVPIPSKTEQKEIVKKVQKLFKKMDRIEKLSIFLTNSFDSIPNSILERAFSGKLVPQNLKDEPVEKLLERIKKEKEKLEAQKKASKKKRFDKKRSKKAMDKEKHINLLDIIKSKPKGISPEDLLNLANYNLKEIDEFYKNLNSIRDKLIEIKPKNSEKVWPHKSSVLLRLKEK